MFAFRLGVLWAVCLSVVLADTKLLQLENPTTTAAADLDYRLPEHITPISYNISLRPYLLAADGDKQFSFDGEVWMAFKTSEVTNNITLHSKNLFHSVMEYWPKSDATAKGISLTVISYNQETEILVLKTDKNLAINSVYILHIKYTGIMDDDMHGFYRSSYVNNKNETKWLGTTQFEPYHARRAFPCLDEPHFKAVFNLSMTRPAAYTTYSNTKVLSSTQTADIAYFVDVFAETPIMSTYLLAFIVSDFKIRSGDDFGVLARSEYYDQTEYSFNVGKKLLVELDKYLNMPYNTLGIKKMDMVAIPDFSAGAMENWGLLTYRENKLLVDEAHTPLTARQSIAAVITHEQAHMWFGDLVTCKWWSYTWLNEGFARYFQYFGTAFVEKDWELEKQFVVDQIQTVMAMDSTYNTNPMTALDTFNAAQITRMFNSISYNKGGTFVRMIEHAMGSSNFQKSLQEYVQKYKYQSTVPENLLNALLVNWPANTKNSASKIFNSFSEQVGYPVINVELSNDGKSIKFSQKRFLLKENDGADRNISYAVPITYTTDVEKNYLSTTPKFVLEGSEKTESLEKAVKWVIGNIQETGYYRVNYTEKNWHAIHGALKATNWSGIHEINRAQIVDDLLNFARSNQFDYNMALGILEYLETETNYIPWTSAFNGFNYLAIRLGLDLKHFSQYIRELTAKSYAKLGFAEGAQDKTLDIYLRSKVLSWNCRYGHEGCVKSAKEHFKSLPTVPKNLRSVVYCVALREGGDAEFNALYEKFQKETVATEENLLQSSFGCVKNRTLIEKVVDIVIKDIRKQDMATVLSTLYTENTENIDPVFEVVTNRSTDLARAMGGYGPVATVISNIAARFTEKSQQEALKKFNEEQGDKFGTAKSTLLSAEKSVEENFKWAEAKLGIFRSYLQRRNGSAMLSAFSALTLLMATLVTMLR